MIVMYICSIIVLYIKLKGLLTKFLVMFQICPKLCMQVDKGYTNKFPQFQVYKLCRGQDIYIQKCVIFGD